MRRLLVAFGLIGLVSDAFAADLPTLRGSDSFLPARPTYFRWDGPYAGVQFSYNNEAADFSNATNPLVAYSLRDTTLEGQVAPSQWQVLRPVTNSAVGFGGFVGYNMQWDNAVIGFELNYTHSALNPVAASTPIGLNVNDSDGNYNVFVSGNASMKIDDFAVLRGRAGWVIGNFMPYVSLGLAVGLADVSVSSTVVVQNTITPIPNPAPGCSISPCIYTSSQAQNAAFLYGYAAGGGVEMALTRNLFARADFEYIQWTPFWGIPAHIDSARLGLGVKF